METSSNLSNYSALDRNMLLEWQWVKKTFFFVTQYPVDIDILTFNSIASSAGFRTSRIKLTISNFESCTFTNLTSEVEKLLWRDLFLNDTNSYLCNRKITDDSFRKTFMFYAFMVWVGYDLSCSINKEHIAYEAVKKEISPLEITLVCVLLSLYYPLIFYLIEMEPLLNKLKSLQEQDKSSNKQLQQSFINEDLTAYNENDAPFGFHRALLKLFYIAKVENKYDSKVKPDGTIDEKWKLSKTYLTNIAACRITTLYFFVLLGFSVLRFYFTRILHSAYDDVYRLGIPFLNSSDHFAFNCMLYFSGIFLGAIFLKICYMIMSPKGIRVKTKEAIIKNTILYNGCSFLSNHSRNESTKYNDDDTTNHSGNEPTKHNDDCCCCKVSIPIEKFVPEDKMHYTQNSLCLRFVERFMNIFSRQYWAALWRDAIYCCFVCHCNSKSVIFLCCIEKIMYVFSLIPLIFLNVLTGLFPLCWIIVYCPYICTKFLIQSICSIRNKCVITILFPLIYIVIVFPSFIFSQWILLSANIYVLRSLLCLSFVSMSFSSHLLKVYIFIVLTIGYFALFVYNFIREYSIILKAIFEEKNCT